MENGNYLQKLRELTAKLNEAAEITSQLKEIKENFIRLETSISLTIADLNARVRELAKEME